MPRLHALLRHMPPGVRLFRDGILPTPPLGRDAPWAMSLLRGFNNTGVSKILQTTLCLDRPMRFEEEGAEDPVDDARALPPELRGGMAELRAQGRDLITCASSEAVYLGLEAAFDLGTPRSSCFTGRLPAGCFCLHATPSFLTVTGAALPQSELPYRETYDPWIYGVSPHRAGDVLACPEAHPETFRALSEAGAEDDDFLVILLVPAFEELSAHQRISLPGRCSVDLERLLAAISPGAQWDVARPVFVPSVDRSTL